MDFIWCDAMNFSWLEETFETLRVAWMIIMGFDMNILSYCYKINIKLYTLLRFVFREVSSFFISHSADRIQILDPEEFLISELYNFFIFFACLRKH